MPSDCLIEARNVGRRADERWLLSDVSLCIEPGERIAIVGPSGSGKTLLLRCLCLLDSPDAGAIRWQGNAVHGSDVPRYRSRVLYLHQRPALFEGTVEEDLRRPFELSVHREKNFDRRQAIQWFETLGRTEAFLDKGHRDLSGGESQIVAMLRALLLEPEVLLLDEPTAALDEQATGQIEALVDHWFHAAPRQRAIVWVTHNDSQARRVASTVYQMNGGTLRKHVDE